MEPQLTSEIDSAIQLYAYQECNDEEGHLKSFTLILSDQNSENRVKLNTIGVVDSKQTCPGYTFSSPLIYRAAIYADETRVYGMRLQSVKGVSDIGSLTGTPILTYFNENQQLIGFYGTMGVDHITSLGFVMHDPECVAVAVTDEKSGTVNGSEEFDIELTTEAGTSEESDETLIVVLVIFGVVLLAAGVVIGCILYKRK